MGPERFGTASFDQTSSDDDAEVEDRVELCERLHPVGHRFNRGKSSRQRSKRGVDEEEGQLRLLCGLRQRCNDCSDAYT